MDPYRTNLISEDQPTPSFDRIANMPPAPVKKKINVGKYVITYYYLDANDKKHQHQEQSVGSKMRMVGEYEYPIEAHNPLHGMRDHGITIYKGEDISSGGTFIPAHRILQADVEYEEYYIEINAKP